MKMKTFNNKTGRKGKRKVYTSSRGFYIIINGKRKYVVPISKNIYKY